MKKRVKLKMEKEVRVRSTNTNNTRASLTAEQSNLTKPERKSMDLAFRHFFATGLLDLANQAVALAKAEEDRSLPEEDACKRDEQAESRNLMIQKRALKEAKLNRGLQLYKSYKKRVKESGLGVCKKRKRFVGNTLCDTLKPLSFGHLLVLANAAEKCLPFGVGENTCKQREAGDMERGGSCFGLPEKLQRNRESVQLGGKTALVKVVEEIKPNRNPCDGCRDETLFEKKYLRRKRVKNKEQLESTSVAGTCNGVKKLCKFKPSRLINVDGLYNNGQTRSKSEQVEVVEARGSCTGIPNKRKRKCKTQRRDENPEIIQESSIIPHILGIKNQEICKRKRSQRKRKSMEPKRNSGSNVGERREEKEGTCDQIDSDAGDLETDNDADKSEEEEENSISEGGSETEAVTDNDAHKPGKDNEENTVSEGGLETEALTDTNTEKPEEEKEEEEENTISKVVLSQSSLGPDISDVEVIVSEQEGSLPFTRVAKTEEEEEVTEACSCNWWSFRKPCSGNGMKQWSMKKKRTRMTLHEAQSNRKILLLALETVTRQLGLLKISSKKKKK